MKPVLEALKAGEKFPFPLLATHFEDCLEHWEWWWSQASMDRLTRPEIISDSDPILQQTEGSLFVDTLTHFDFFDKFLCAALSNKLLPFGDQIPRADYQDALTRLLSARGVAQTERVAVFVGGGYGAGKTNILSMEGKRPFLPLPNTAIVGVDSFKLYLPEYEAIRRIGDGRASSVVQGEARKLSEGLLERLLHQGKSFMWDSSMSDEEASLRRVRAARAQGYRLILVAVASPVEAAIGKAMARARTTRRFAHPAHLADSHRNFARAFDVYFDEFDEVMLFWNPWHPGLAKEQPTLIAKKDPSDNSLVSYDDTCLEHFRGLAADQS